MGLSASQARLLSLTSRIHDVEFEAQQVQYAKLKLAMLEDDVLKKYEEELDAETLTISGPENSRIPATFDNICGLGSLNNKFGKNHYVFRDKSDRLIVPNDVYQGYLDYGTGDPYEFAMKMLEADTSSEDYSKKIDELLASEKYSDVNELREVIYSKIGELFQYANETEKNAGGDNGGEKSKSEFIENFFKDLLAGGEVMHHLSIGEDTMITFDGKKLSLKDAVEALKENAQTYEFKLFQKHDGAKEILGEDNYDEGLFDYYVRWGQLIEAEGGLSSDGKSLVGCTNASDYQNDIESDPQLLQQGIMSGYISVDIVYDNNRTGGISWEATTPATDTYLHMDKKATVDSTALKKAELERDRKLKDINQIDKRYDMTLNRLETERTALTAEYDSVKKVITDNIERSFKIFS